MKKVLISINNKTVEQIDELKVVTSETKTSAVISDAVKLYYNLERYRQNGSEVILRFEGEDTKVLF